MFHPRVSKSQHILFTDNGNDTLILELLQRILTQNGKAAGFHEIIMKSTIKSD